MVEQLAPEDLVEDDWSDLSASSLGAGARLGRYELLLPIAYGGMARVWAARQHGQRGFTKLVAIKTILPHLASDPEFERMLHDEARIAACVRHPNVCEIYDLGEEGRVVYMAMEWISGDSFVHVLRAGRPQAMPIDPRLAARIVADACAGLHAAHNLKSDDGDPLEVVHRDVSPHNILVSLDGTVKVADFGVAKALGQLHAPTMAGQVKGKLAYMAPEQVSGTRLDRRADVYSLGIVLYEATVGVVPYRGENDLQTMQALMRAEHDPPTRLIPGYPQELERIIECAIHPDPRARFPTADRLRTALEEWLARSGPIVTSSHVAALVRSRIGPLVDRRLEQIRAAQALSQDASLGVGNTPSSRNGGMRSGVVVTGMAPQRRPSMPPPAVGPSPVPSRPPPPLPGDAPRWGHAAGENAGQPAPGWPAGAAAEPPGAGRATLPSARRAGVGGAFLAVGIASVAVLALGVVGVVAWRLLRAPGPVASSAVTAPSPSAPPAQGSSASVLFRVAPEDAVIRVDGRDLMASERVVPRPPPGTTASVVVHLSGFDDQAVVLDSSVPSTIDVVLVPTGSAAAPPTSRVLPPTATPLTSATVRLPLLPPSATVRSTAPAIPANPY